MGALNLEKVVHAQLTRTWMTGEVHIWILMDCSDARRQTRRSYCVLHPEGETSNNGMIIWAPSRKVPRVASRNIWAVKCLVWHLSLLALNNIEKGGALRLRRNQVHLQKISNETRSTHLLQILCLSGVTYGISGMDKEIADTSGKDFSRKHSAAKFLLNVRYSDRYHGCRTKYCDDILFHD